MSLKISVITVVKNGMPFLKDSINSFNKQNYKDKELIIVYSDSTDATVEYIKKIKKKNIRIIRDKVSKNKFGALNLGIKKSKGHVIGILHSDDFYPNKNVLNDIVKTFKSKKCDVVYGNLLFCKINKKKIVRKWLSDSFKKQSLKFGWMPPHTTIYVNSKIIRKNLYSLKYPISGDYKFVLELFNKKLNFIFLNKYLCNMRVGGDSTKIKNLYKKLKEDISIAKLYFNNYIICIVCKILRKVNQFLI
jgi:glycosyltransferase involved in cell wall biosynthesis